MSTLHTDGLKVSDVMLPLDRFPVVPKTMYLKSAMEEMGKRRLGIVCVVDESGKLAGVFTDGDVRRKLLSVQKPFSAFFIDDVIDHAVLDPLTISASARLMDAVKLMEEREIWDMPVVSDDGSLKGLLHLHPVVQTLLGMER